MIRSLQSMSSDARSKRSLSGRGDTCSNSHVVLQVACSPLSLISHTARLSYNIVRSHQITGETHRTTKDWLLRAFPHKHSSKPSKCTAKIEEGLFMPKLALP